jgi:hypothetical protein
VSNARLYSLVEAVAGAAAIAFGFVFSPVIRSWYSTWGAIDEEVQRSLPGDDIVPQPELASTRAVTIGARAAEVWPWLVQIGQGRGGFYSYDGLENLVGCQIHSAEWVIPEFQLLDMGDKVRLGPEGYPFFKVVAIDPERALVLQGGANEEQEPTSGSTWVFVLDEQGDGTTRLIVRSRTAYRQGCANLMIWRVFTDPISFVMERKMLLGIKARVERSASL